ncbi:entericidin A/B family lipoprotein [Brucella anthropi]|nr:entericidin A/B family lipoprotein [Ochrobactrum sp. UNC390CL2Tsu3S39]
MLSVKTLPIVIVACSIALASCTNTVRGVGRDVQGTTNAVEDTVE